MLGKKSLYILTTLMLTLSVQAAQYLEHGQYMDVYRQVGYGSFQPDRIYCGVPRPYTMQWDLDFTITQSPRYCVPHRVGMEHQLRKERKCASSFRDNPVVVPGSARCELHPDPNVTTNNCRCFARVETACTSVSQ